MAHGEVKSRVSRERWQILLRRQQGGLIMGAVTLVPGADWRQGNMQATRTPLGLWVTLDGALPAFEGGTALERQRMGWLLLVPGVAEDVPELAQAAKRYYGSPRFDVEPMLREILGHGVGDDGAWSCCGAVLAGLDLTALLPLGYGVWVADDHGLRAIPSWPVGAAGSDGLAPLRRCHHRMRPGETVLVGGQMLGGVGGRRRIARLAGPRPERFRRMLQRAAARQGVQGTLPFALVHYPTGPAVALQQPWDRPAVLLPPRPMPTSRTSGLSPVLIALAIMVLSAVGVYAVKRPSLPEASLAETLTFILTIDRLGQMSGGEGDGVPPPGE
jgi:hypothetical protein